MTNEHSDSTNPGFTPSPLLPGADATAMAPPTHNIMSARAGPDSIPAKARKPSTVGLYDSGIWSSGMGKSFNTEHQPMPRGQPKQSTGSGLLLDDSVSEHWARTNDSKKAPGAMSAATRGKLNDVISPMGTNSFTNGHHHRPSYSKNFGGNALADYEQQPFTYQKTAGPSPNGDHQLRETIGRLHGSAHASPSDERRAWLPGNGLSSVAASRDGSLPPSRDSDMQMINGAASHANGYRRGSTPHAHPALSNNSPEAVSRALMQMGQLSIHSPAQSNGTNHHVHRVPSVDAANFAARRPSRQFDGLPMDHQGLSTNGDMYGSSQPNFGGSMPPVASNNYQSHIPIPRSGGTRPPSLNSLHDPRRDSAQSYAYSSAGYPPPMQPSWGYHHPQVPMYDPTRQQYDPRVSPAAALQSHHYNMPFPSNHGANGGLAPFSSPIPGQSQPADNQNGTVRRSQVLEDFKSNGRTGRRFELRDALGHIVEFSGDQFGSRFIQAKLETSSSEEKNMIFQEIMSNSVQLMTDIFGNYVIQKLFEHGDQYQKRALAQQMKGRVVSLSVQMYGCRVVQKAFEHVLTDQQAMLVSEFAPENVLRCVKDQNGNHVIQKAIERCPAQAIRPIIDAFKTNVMTLSQHAYGCRVIQRVLEFCEQPDKDAMMAELHDGMPSLVADQYGNYVVQHVVSHGRLSERQHALSIVMTNLEFYCKHKFASNVVETCIKHGGLEFHKQMLDRFVFPRAGQETMLLGMIKDGYGNYVVQKMLEILPEQEYLRFVEQLETELPKARKTACGKQIMAIEKRMRRYNHSVPQPRPLQASRSSSDEATPALTFTSIQSSAMSSINGDTGEGTTGRKF